MDDEEEFELTESVQPSDDDGCSTLVTESDDVSAEEDDGSRSGNSLSPGSILASAVHIPGGRDAAEEQLRSQEQNDEGGIRIEYDLADYYGSRAPSLVQELHSHAIKYRPTFRVLYLGDASVKSDILAKLGNVLAVSAAEVDKPASVSRFNLVPVSLDPSAKQVELVEIADLELQVEAGSVKSGKGTQVSLWVDDKRVASCVKWQQETLRLYGWEPPHLIVAVHPSKRIGGDAEQFRHIARFATVTNTPILHLTSSIDVFPASSSLIEEAARVHLFAVQENTDEPRFRPLPLEIFAAMDNTHINRAIAFAQSLPKKASSAPSPSPSPQSGEVVKTNHLWGTGREAPHENVIMRAFLVCLSILIVVALQALDLRWTPSANVPEPQAVPQRALSIIPASLVPAAIMGSANVQHKPNDNVDTGVDESFSKLEMLKVSLLTKTKIKIQPDGSPSELALDETKLRVFRDGTRLAPKAITILPHMIVVELQREDAFGNVDVELQLGKRAKSTHAIRFGEQSRFPGLWRYFYLRPPPLPDVAAIYSRVDSWSTDETVEAARRLLSSLEQKKEQVRRLAREKLASQLLNVHLPARSLQREWVARAQDQARHVWNSAAMQSRDRGSSSEG